MSEQSLDSMKEELLALLLEEQEENISHSKNLALVPGRREASLLLSFAQQRLWFLDQLETSQAFYNIPVAIQMSGKLDVLAFSNTINEIVRRHEVLRTHFANKDGTPVQVIAPTLDLDIPLINLSALTQTEREERCQRMTKNEARTPFDLSTGPLIRVRLLQLEPTKYIVLFTLHHIVSDGWSMGVLINEMATLYSAYVQEEPSPLPELTVQYADFALWQRQWFSGKVQQQQLDYWTEQLRGVQSVLTLPTDRQRPLVQTYHGAACPFEVSAETTAGLRALNKQTQTTLFMVLTAVCNILLSRYSGQDDICIGTSIANRNHAEIKPLIGFFVNTLVLRSTIDSQESFASLLQQVRRTTLDAYNHQDVPFEQLVDAIKPIRDLSHTPLFQVMLVLQNAPIERLELPGLTLEPAVTGSDTVKFDLTLDISEKANQIVGTIEYNTDLFDQKTIVRMAGHFCHLLNAVAFNPDCRIADLPMLSTDERKQLLVDWNKTSTDYTKTQTIHELFEAQVRYTPEATAVVYENRTLSYTQLNSRANKLAHYLRQKGVGPDTLVGICVERSLEMIVGLLGILKAGGAYVPLDPSYPEQRLAYVLEDANPKVLLTQQHLKANLRTYPNGMVAFCLDTQWNELVNYSSDNPRHITRPNNLAYVIYTSGSTGKPKGVLLQHSNVVRLFAATDAWFGFNEKDVWSLFHSYAFDFSVWEIWGALLHGGKLVIVPFLVSRTPEQFYALLVQEKVTVLNQTPSAFLQLIQIDADQANPSGLSLEKVIFGGEALNKAALSPWFIHHGDKKPKLINMYGITETTVHVTYFHLQENDKKSALIGRPIPDLSTFILDDKLNPVPVGVAGELHIGGDGLARGYLNRPELTAEKFIPNPFSPVPGARIYRTGDLARYLPDGNIEYLGRIDHQVKIRGFRIELGEIETALMALPAIQEATVLVREDMPGDKRLVAYYVAETGAEQLENDAGLRSTLIQSLPDYMVPAHFISLEQLPLTPNGKINRKALPAPDMVRSDVGYVAPQTVTEASLAQIWADVLKLDKVGMHDNFFELGGNSILAVQLHARVKADLKPDLSLSTIFSAPTLAGFTQIIDAPSNPVPVSTDLLVPFQNGTEEPPLFLLHPAGGTIFCYTSLIEHIHEGCSVYAIQAPEIAGLEMGAYDFDDLCQRYVAEISTSCPAGKLRLGGWSMGGALAYRIVEMLEAANRTVEWLALLDVDVKFKNDKSVSYEEFIEHLVLQTDTKEFSIDHNLAQAHRLLRKKAIAYGARFTDKLRQNPNWLKHMGIDSRYVGFINQQYQLQLKHSELLQQFEPGMINSPVHVVWAGDKQNEEVIPIDWLKLTRATEQSTQRILPGTHRTVIQIEKNVKAIVKTWEAASQNNNEVVSA